MKPATCGHDFADIDTLYYEKDARGKWKLREETMCKWCFIQTFAHDRPSPPGFFRGARVYRR